MKKRNETHYECEACHYSFFNNAKAAVFLVFAKGDAILVSERGREPHKGDYDLPGGFVDFGEDAYTTAIREASEELGVSIRRDDLELLAVYHNNYIPGVFTVDIGFLVREWQGEFNPGDDVAKVTWRPFSFINDPTFCERHYTGLDTLLTERLGK